MVKTKTALRVVIVAGVLVPPLLGLIAVAFQGSLQYRVSTLLLPLTIANILPFCVFYLLARSDLADVERGRLRQRDVVIRLGAAWIAMVGLATAISTGIVRSGLARLPGSSTDAVIVILSPMFLFGVGLGAYALLWALTAIVSLIRPQSH